MSGAAGASFAYDGDGNRVKVDGGVTTYYVGRYYEKQGSIVTKYYYFAGKRVAMRKGGTLTYLHGDHLGSTSLATTATGGFLSRVLYYPYGEMRTGNPTALPTDYQYTGQRHDVYTQLYEMGARWYDAQIGRWISADTIVPDPANPQSFNRFAYVLGNPLRYVDPTGYFEEDAIIEYLKGIYGDQQTEDTKELVWRLVLQSWKSNEALWNMLGEATANDVLMYVNGNDQVCFSRFLGEGQDKLWGIEGLPLPDIGGALGAKHDPNNDIGLPGVLQNNDIVGLFAYNSRAHLELKYSGAGLGTWSNVRDHEITSLEVAMLKMGMTAPFWLLSGPASAGSVAFETAVSEWVVQEAGRRVVGGLFGWAAGGVLAHTLGIKAGNDIIAAENGFDSLKVTLDRGVVHPVGGVTRWDWQGLP